MLIPLQLPPGVVKNGTPYQRKGRWEDSNLVRWYEGSIRTIGGWLRRADLDGVSLDSLTATPTLEAFRDGFSWRSLNQDQNVVFGSNLTLWHVSQTGVLTNITPVTMVTSDKDAVFTTGYGENPYSIGAYGVENALNTADPIPPNRWAFDTFGQLLIAQQRNIGPMYELAPSSLIISEVTGAPDASQDVIVTDQRIVFTVGADNQPRLAKWSDQEDRNSWVAAVNNQAGDITLQGSGRLLRCINVLKQVLVIGETDAFTARYVGPPYVYSFDLAGRNCGMIAAEAVVTTDRFAVWWGDRQFWLFDGAVQQLPCDVIEFLYADANLGQVSKISAFSNRKFSEVWWLYQSTTSTTGEVDSYVVWNYTDNTWLTGRLDRTVGIDVGTLRVPLQVDSAGFIYNHELAGVQVAGTAFVRSAAIDIGGGQTNMAVRYIYPDTETAGDVTMMIYGRQFPSDSVYEYGPYTYSNPTPTRAMGREMAFRFDFLTPLSEVGVMRLDVAPMGTGKR